MSTAGNPSTTAAATVAGSESDPLPAYYAARAPEYDRVYLKPERQADLRAIEAWLPAQFAGHCRAGLLELACGTGYWTRFLVPVSPALLALDAAEPTLAIARERIARQCAAASSRVSFEIGDAYALAGVALGRPFDAAYAGFWWSHVPRERLGAFLADLHQRLAPGARVVFLDNLNVDGSSTPLSDWDDAGNSYQARPLADGSVHRVLKNFPDQAELDGVIQAAGGQSLQHQRWPHYWAVSYRTPNRPGGSDAAPATPRSLHP